MYLNKRSKQIFDATSEKHIFQLACSKFMPLSFSWRLNSPIFFWKVKMFFIGPLLYVFNIVLLCFFSYLSCATSVLIFFKFRKKKFLICNILYLSWTPPFQSGFINLKTFFFVQTGYNFLAWNRLQIFSVKYLDWMSK